MEIEYKIACLIEAGRKGHVQAIAQGNNCFNTMKSGLAPQIAKMYPEAEWVDKQTTKGDPDKLGTITLAQYESSPHLVFNIYQQFGYGKDEGKVYVSYNAIDSGLWLVNEQVINHNEAFPENKIVKIGFPRIGCGLAGGDWDRVSKLIEKNITSATPVVYDLEKK